MSEGVIVAAITLIGVTVTAVFSYLAARSGRRAVSHVTSIDDAVNHRQPGEPRLVELVRTTSEDVDRLGHVVHEIQQSMLEHVMWEESQKYMTPEEVRMTVHTELMAWMESREK